MDLFKQQHTRLRFLRSLIGLSRAAIEDKYRLPEITLKKWETGKLPISEKAISKCLEIYKNEQIFVTYEWLKEGIGPLPTFIISTENIDPDISYFKNTYPNAIIYTIENNDMLPKYQEGEQVIGLAENDNYKKFNNLDCLVTLENNEIIFRKVIIQEAHIINLFCTNNLITDTPALFNVKPISIAPIIWHRIRKHGFVAQIRN